MTDGNKLKEIIRDKGLKIDFICAKLNCTYATFRRKINNENEFLASEIAILCELLHFTESQMIEIFFAKKVSDTQPKEEEEC